MNITADIEASNVLPIESSDAEGAADSVQYNKAITLAYVAGASLVSYLLVASFVILQG